jgi:hypothetical protein
VTIYTIICYFSESDNSSDESEIDVRYRPASTSTATTSALKTVTQNRSGKSSLNDSINLTTASSNNHINNNNSTNNTYKNNISNTYEHDRDDNTPR